MHHRCINRELVGIFDYKKGHTKCVPYISYIDLSGPIKIFRRPNIAKECLVSQGQTKPPAQVKECV